MQWHHYYMLCSDNMVFTIYSPPFLPALMRRYLKAAYSPVSKRERNRRKRHGTHTVIRMWALYLVRQYSYHHLYRSTLTYLKIVKKKQKPKNKFLTYLQLTYFKVKIDQQHCSYNGVKARIQRDKNSQFC